MEAMEWDLATNANLWEAKTEPDPDKVAKLIQIGMAEVLEYYAPRRVIQTRNKPAIDVTQQTREVQFEAANLKQLATQTNQPAIWQEYRRVRNRASSQAKTDYKSTLTNRLEGNDRRRVT